MANERVKHPLPTHDTTPKENWSVKISARFLPSKI